MRQWEVTVSFAIKAESRKEVWEIARSICRDKLKDVADVRKVSLIPFPRSEEGPVVN